MSDVYEESDADYTCAICGRHLSPINRSVAQPDLCKDCSGEENDTVIDDFK